MATPSHKINVVRSAGSARSVSKEQLLVCGQRRSNFALTRPNSNICLKPLQCSPKLDVDDCPGSVAICLGIGIDWRNLPE